MRFIMVFGGIGSGDRGQGTGMHEQMKRGSGGGSGGRRQAGEKCDSQGGRNQKKQDNKFSTLHE